MNVKQVITTLKKAETVPEYTEILQKIGNSQFAGSTAADSKDLNTCLATIFEKSLINNTETDHEILLTFLSNVPTLLTRSRGKIFKYLAETFHPEIWANLFRTTAPSKQSGEWQKMLKDCVEVIEDIYNQVMSGVPNSEIIIQAESSLQVKDIRKAGECLNFLIKSRPKNTFLNLTEMVGLITDCKKSYFSEFMRSALLKTLIDETPRLHLGRVRTVIFNYLVKAKDYSGLALILLKFGSIVSVDLFRLNEDEFSILEVYKSEKVGSREFLLDLISLGGVPAGPYTTIQSEISKELWNVNRKTKFDSEKLDALAIFEAMIYQPVERMRPLQIGEQLLSNILNNCKIGVCLRRKVRKMLQIISASLQPVVKEVVIEVIVEVEEEMEGDEMEVDEMGENVENVHIEIPAKMLDSKPVEPVKIPIVSNVRKSGRTSGTINYNDVIPAKVARIEKNENESRASAFINQMKNEGKSSASAEKNEGKVENVEKVEVEIATGENGDEASVDDMLACLE